MDEGSTDASRRRIESRRLGVAVALGLSALLLGCDTSREHKILNAIVEPTFFDGTCFAEPLKKKLGRPREEPWAYPEACRKWMREEKFKNKVRFETRDNRTLDGIKEYLIAQRFACEEKRVDDKKSLVCAFLHEPTFPGLVFGTYSMGLYKWTVEAEEASEGALSLNVQVVRLERG